MLMMKRRIIVGICLLNFCLLLGVSHGWAASPSADFKEVYDLLRANLAGANDVELNRAAVEGLIAQLNPQVSVVGESGTAKDTNSPPAISTAIFERAYGYVRIGRIAPGVDKQLADAYQGLTSTNRLRGVVFDLRYASGHDYATAAAMADAFFTTEKPLMDWGEGLKKSTAKTNAVSLPITILVNKKTSGAAEAFAGVLRQAEVGLILGANTAGQASIAKEFSLKNGQRLRIATTPIKMADGKDFPAGGLKPDITVEVASEDERSYFEDAYKGAAKTNRLASVSGSSTNQASATGTNRPPRRRMNEAELVRMLREGQNPDLETTPGSREADNSKPLVTDPALTRAIDLLKGLSVVQQFRSL